MTSIAVSVPSAKAAVPESEPSTTCALVSSSPSSVNSTAEPAPCCRREPHPLTVTASAATRGITAAATSMTTRE